MVGPAIRQAVLAYLLLTFQAVLFVATTLALARVVGARASAAQIGAGRVARLKISGVQVDLGLLPGLSSVTMVGRAPDDTDDNPGSWRRLGLARRLIVLLGPWAVTLLIAVICLSPSRAFTSFARAVPQILFVLDTTPLVRGFLRVMASEPIFIVLGVVCAKLTAMNLLPLPSLAGGAALRELFGARKPPVKDEKDATPGVLPVVGGLVLFLYIAGRFAWGLIQALSSGA
jgi:hypothetical protein